MDDTKSFAEDLVNLRDDIASDVGGILQVVRERKESKSRPTAPAKPARDETPVTTASQSIVRSRNVARVSTAAESPLENVTTRLRRDTNQRLSEAALRQKLKKASPDTRQGIIEAAVVEWLSRQGYVK